MTFEYNLATYDAARSFVVREERSNPLPEQVVQQFWYDHAIAAGPMQCVEGHRVEVVSPGWWNHCAGPDFQGAQLRFNGTLFTGDVEIHLEQSAWYQHGHHRDERYNNVLLHVVLHPPGESSTQVETAAGNTLPHLVLDALCQIERGRLKPLLDVETAPDLAPRCHGSCNRFVADGEPEILTDFLRLSGDWRLLNKTRYVQERIAAVGADQAAYELIARALGYRPFVDHFERIARALPYERAIQLAHQEPFLLEAALLYLADLFPAPHDSEPGLSPHAERLMALQRQHFPQMRPLGLDWKMSGVRPNNYPGRRLAGLAALVGRVSRLGLVTRLDRLWKEEENPVALRREFEQLFPGAMGYWAHHYRLDRPAMTSRTAPVGAGRVRSIIGNVFVPLALARARMSGQRGWEEQILDFYHRLPMEPDNTIYKRMLPRILGDHTLRIGFQSQQGILQLHEDWCKSNPSCKDCALLAYLDGQSRREAT